MAETKRNARNLMIGAGVLLLAGIGGCAVVAASIGTSMTEGIDEAAKRNMPREVEADAAFTLGKHETLAGWTVADTDGRFGVVGTVRNVSDQRSKASFRLKFRVGNEPNLSEGDGEGGKGGGIGKVVGDVECSSSMIEPGQTAELHCLPDGLFGQYTRITAEAIF
ncbi:hypothetical protein [Kribbella sp. NPDC051718]|uniref:hypothetical protein n=1 Tax=Kribbella sp. NPDC051718 TaxID=3155168 RepID=UPI003435D0C0